MVENSEEIEVLREMEPFVRLKLKYLTGDRRKWWASQFFDFMEESDAACFKQLAELREEARGLSNEELVALVGNEVTEEALPNYSRALANLFNDPSGVSDNAWNIWERGWTAEEKMHGRVLDRYLFLTGKVNQKTVDASIDSLIERGMEQSPSIFRGLVYPAFQEPATALSHMNMAKIARRKGVKTLYEICTQIAGDESRHAAFYLDIVSRMMVLAPERTILAYNELMHDSVVMPAKNMTDSTYTTPPTLFEHFAGVANRIGIYTSFDYADIVEKLNKAFNIARISVKEIASEAQDYLANLPSRLRRFAERTKYRIKEPVSFDWIYGQKA